MAISNANSFVQYVKRSTVVGGRDLSGKGHWVPNTDVYVTEEGMVIKVELAGMRSDDLQITVEGAQLRITGERHDGCRAPKCTFLVMEINYGPFESVLELPEGYDLGHAKASYLNGFLRIDVPLSTKSSAKTTQISIASSPVV